ncbi:MAG: protein translocase subunit SecF [Candidatus Margulisiibacteriota bacterium]
MNIIGRKNLWFTLSAVLIALGIFGFSYNMLIHGRAMNFGIDFTGGTIITLRFEQGANVSSRLAEVRKVLDGFKFRESTIQKSGDNDITIRTEPLDGDTRTKIIAETEKTFGRIELLEADTIGPVIGAELRAQAFWALLIATIGILIYVSFRFEFKYAVAAVIALWHDAIITVGLIALLYKSVDTAFIAAILTILGYSINDTIVIFDRIRENIAHQKKGKVSYEDVANTSIRQTMARSINTILTVLFMNVCLLIFGGATIKDFALTLLIGFTLGGYSSIFIASPILVMLEGSLGKPKTKSA